MKLFEIARKRKRGVLGLVSDAQFEAHKEAKIKTHQWKFNGTVRLTGKKEQLVIQMCSVCRKTRQLNDRGKVVPSR